MVTPPPLRNAEMPVFDDVGPMVRGWLLDGKGGGRQVSWQEVLTWRPEQGPLWAHLDRQHPETRRWLREASGLDELVWEAVLAEETRPRAQGHGDCALVNLRGINQNPGEDPDDMVSLRMWFEPMRILTFRRLPVMAVRDLHFALEAGRGPTGVGDLLCEIAEYMVDGIEPVVNTLEEVVDELEEQQLARHRRRFRSPLSDDPAADHVLEVRSQAANLRRYIAPQKDALNQACNLSLPWITPLHQRRLREVSDIVQRQVEVLEAIREHALILSDRIEHRMDARLNRTMFVLSAVAAVFMPLTVLTGMMGMNVGGIPFAESPHGFLYSSIVMGLVLAVILWAFKKLGWL